MEVIHLVIITLDDLRLNGAKRVLIALIKERLPHVKRSSTITKFKAIIKKVSLGTEDPDSYFEIDGDIFYTAHYSKIKSQALWEVFSLLRTAVSF